MKISKSAVLIKMFCVGWVMTLIGFVIGFSFAMRVSGELEKAQSIVTQADLIRVLGNPQIADKVLECVRRGNH